MLLSIFDPAPYNVRFLDTQERVEWGGVNFSVHSIKDDYELLLPQGQDPRDAETIVSNNQFSVSHIRSHYPKYPFKFTCMVLPEESFAQVAGIPSNFDWARVCVRAVRGPLEDTVVYCQGYWRRGDWVLMSDEELAERNREVAHENFHLMWSLGLGLEDFAKPVEESLVEVYARYIEGLQLRLSKSTRFLQGLSVGDILSLERMWQGFYNISPDPVSKNIAYASAFLWGMGFMRRVERFNSLDKTEAFDLWLEALSGANDVSSLFGRLSKISGTGEDTLFQSIQLQQEGQMYLDNKILFH